MRKRNDFKLFKLAGRLALLALACGGAAARADVTLPKVFSDGMVLQREQPVSIWGRATPAGKISISFAGVTTDVTVDAAGKWWTLLPPLDADATPRDLTITGDGPTVTVRNVLVGDVWFCSGQSNLGYALSKATGGPEAAAAARDDSLRFFKVDVDGTPTPQEDVRGTWTPTTPETAEGVSAVAFWFASELRKTVNVPIGVVQASIGGSPIEAWSRRQSLDGVGFMKPMLKRAEVVVANGKAAVAKDPATQPFSELVRKSTPGWLYNGCIAPLAGMRVRGFVWYQGESNVDNAEQYKTLFPRMIQDWRRQWDIRPIVPFLFVQIAARDSNADESLGSPTADLRLAQSMALDQPSTGMAVAIDTRAADWHPADKRPVARRLAALAMKLAYGKDVVTGGPIWVGRKFEAGKVTLRFHSPGGLVAPGDEPSGFMIAGEDRRFVPADAVIIGKERDTIELTAEGVDKPVAVRYGWTRGPVCDLTNTAGFPTAPFRTDDWPTPTTKPAK
ncbi:MAG: sialate O-acetylesterase [Tepidisphaeraceae bacterium]